MKNPLLISLAALWAFSATASRADQFQATINIDPAFYSLGGVTLPLQLDFQLNSGGSAPISNTVTLSDFSFVTDNAQAVSFGVANPSGNVSGDLTGSVSLTDDSNNNFNEFFQSLSSNVTQISFDINATDNVNPAANDTFAVALLDSSSGFPQIPATDPLGVSLITLDLSDQINANAYASVSPLPGVTAAVAAVPIPASVWLFASAVAAGASRLRRAS